MLFRSDGRRAVSDGFAAVITNDQGPTAIPEGRYAKIPERTLALLKDEKEIKLPAEQIIRMFGECVHPMLHECPNCQGKGLVEHTCEDCYGCEGKGKVEQKPDDRYCSVWGKPFNPNRVAYILAHTPKADEYTVRLVDGSFNAKDLWSLHIVTERWHAVLVGFAERVLGEHDCPEVMEASAVR